MVGFAAAFASPGSSAAQNRPFGPCTTKPDCRGKACCKDNDYKRLEMAIADAEYRAWKFEKNSILLDPGVGSPEAYQNAVQDEINASLGSLLRAKAAQLGFDVYAYGEPPYGETSCLGGKLTAIKYKDGLGGETMATLTAETGPGGAEILHIGSVVDTANGVYKGAGHALDGVCREQIAALLAHEGDHRSRCAGESAAIAANDAKFGELAKKLGVKALGQKVTHRDDEAAAYHAEAKYLRDRIRESKERCCKTCVRPKELRGDAVAKADAALMTQLMKAIKAQASETESAK